MKIKDLRIDNFVLVDNSIKQISEIRNNGWITGRFLMKDKKNITSSQFHIDNAKCIKICKKWLNLLGFEFSHLLFCTDENYEVYRHKSRSEGHVIGDFVLDKKEGMNDYYLFENADNCRRNIIQFVHELQNLIEVAENYDLKVDVC